MSRFSHGAAGSGPFADVCVKRNKQLLTESQITAVAQGLCMP